MTATTHLLTGTAIGLLIKEPFVALPLALASHYICDTLPHFGLNTWEKRQQNLKIFKVVTIIDVIFFLSLLIFLFSIQINWFVIACGIAAYLPDSAWLYRFVIVENMGTKPFPPMNRLNQFHVDIQKYESVWPGSLVEFIFLALSSLIIASTVI